MRVLALFFLLLVSVNVVASASVASSVREVVNGVVSNAASGLVKKLWSLKSTGTAKAVSSQKSSVKFESGYSVETVFDGSKLGIEPYSVEVTQSGDLLVLDSVSSNLYKMSLPLSKYSRPKLVAGSADGYAGHVDGRPREARMNHPKGFAVDGRGNIYVADTTNMAVRKISDSGVTTIAGGKKTRGSHNDGLSEDAKFSTDFDVVYIASSCSLLVIDRGNQAIREIQLHFDDCAYQYENGFPLGIIVLLAAVFFGYMLAMLQRRVGVMVVATDETQALTKESLHPYQKHVKSSPRPPLIPTGDEAYKAEEEEHLLGSTRKLLSGAFSSTSEVLGALLPFRKKTKAREIHQQETRPNSWPVQESFVIPDDEMPPVVDTRAPTPQKTYAFMSKEPEKIRHIRRELPYFTGWDGDSQKQQQVQRKHHLQHHRQQSSGPQTYYEQSCESSDVVFGAVQESDSKRRTVEMKAVDYGDPINELRDLRYRNRFTDFSYNY